MPRSLRRLALAALLLVPFLRTATARERFFVTSDGVWLHYTEQGPRSPGHHPLHTIVFVPGLAMPAWIWAGQMAAFRTHYRVVAFDPRGQGRSEIAVRGYTAARRGQDLAELLARLGPGRVLLVAWSLGVLDTLAYIHAEGDRRLAGLVLVDNSVGEPPPPVWHPGSGRPRTYRAAMTGFVRSLFRTAQPTPWLDRLTAASLRLPPADEQALRTYAEPREFWRTAVEGLRPPVLYIVRPWLAAQAANLQAARPGTEVAIFHHAGHALFVDDPTRFDALLKSFIRRRVWP